MTEYVLSALVFGITAGFKPGPLGILVIQQTLEHGLRHGVRASLAPVITDGPIILIALLLLTRFKEIDIFVGILGFVGGLYLLWISRKMFRIDGLNLSGSLERPNSLETAIKVNLLSPNPYLFWFTVGGTYLVMGTQVQATVFVIVIVGSLVMTKMLTAWIAANFRGLLESNAYVWVMKGLGVLLVGFGLLFVTRSLRILLG